MGTAGGGVPKKEIPDPARLVSLLRYGETDKGTHQLDALEEEVTKLAIPVLNYCGERRTYLPKAIHLGRTRKGKLSPRYLVNIMISQLH